MPRKNYYDVLGVATSASPEEIRRAYLAQRALYPPGIWTEVPQGARSEVRVLDEAYDVLSDPLRREEYDHSVDTLSDSVARRRGTRKVAPNRLSRRIVFALVAFLVGLVVFLVAAYTVPVTQSFQMIIGEGGSTAITCTESHSFSPGSRVSFSWTGMTGGYASLAIVSPGGTSVLTSSSPQGSYSFTSSGGSYQFEVEGCFLLYVAGSNGVAISGQSVGPWV